MQSMRDTIDLNVNDGILFACIAVATIAAYRIPETNAFDPEYPTVLYYTFTTAAQVLAPVLLMGIASSVWLSTLSSRIELQRSLKGVAITTISLVLALFLLPFAEELYSKPGVRQAAIAFMLLMTLWSIVASLVPVTGLLARSLTTQDGSSEAEED